jgi:CRP-like cAMP-binding protein
MPLESAVSVELPGRAVNHLIEGLPHRQRHSVLARAEPVELELGAILCEPEQRYRHVYFPLTGFISLVATVGSRQPMEMGLIGNEGMLGATLMLGIYAIPLRGVVQGPGTALRMTVAQLRHALGDSPALRRTLSRYLYLSIAQLSQSAVCTQFHEVEARLARWLLMTHDRAHADHFHLTHQLLADMLGVRRSAVTIAAGALRRRNLIRYVRGKISILSRQGLEAASCECYQAAAGDYARLFT